MNTLFGVMVLIIALGIGFIEWKSTDDTVHSIPLPESFLNTVSQVIEAQAKSVVVEDTLYRKVLDLFVESQVAGCISVTDHNTGEDYVVSAEQGECKEYRGEAVVEKDISFNGVVVGSVRYAFAFKTAPSSWGRMYPSIGYLKIAEIYGDLYLVDEDLTAQLLIYEVFDILKSDSIVSDVMILDKNGMAVVHTHTGFVGRNMLQGAEELREPLLQNTSQVLVIDGVRTRWSQRQVIVDGVSVGSVWVGIE